MNFKYKQGNLHNIKQTPQPYLARESTGNRCNRKPGPAVNGTPSRT